MSMFESQWPAFILDLAIGVFEAFVTGFGKRMGEEAWVAVKSRLFAPEPVQVAASFEATLYEPGGCLWVLICEAFAIRQPAGSGQRVERLNAANGPSPLCIAFPLRRIWYKKPVASRVNRFLWELHSSQ